MTERRNRSDKYQYLICEVICTYEYLSSFSNGDSLAFKLNPYEYDERIYELEDELKKLFWQICEEVMTERQKLVMKMLAAGKTQQEVADELGVNQSSITKSLNGNVDYSKKNPDGSPKVYGGVIKKFRKLMKNYPRVQEILNELSELRNERQ